MIKPCDGARCDSAYQDQKYGRNMRVCNKTKDGSYRCTVCDRSVGGAPSKAITGKK